MDKREINREKVKKHPAPSKNGKPRTKIRSPFAENGGKPAEKNGNESGRVVGKKTLKRSIGSGFYIAAAVIVVVAAMTWAFSAFFTVGEIRVSGNSKLSAEEIIAMSGIEYGDSLVLLNGPKIEKNIVGNSVYIEDVTVKRILPDIVELTVTDKTVAIAFEANGAYWLAGGNGTLLELSLKYPEDALLIKGATLERSAVGRTYSCADDAKQTMLEAVLDGIRESGLSDRISLVDISETYSVVMVCDDSFDIILGRVENIRSDCLKIESVIEQAKQSGSESGCIDMRDGSIRFTSRRWQGNILE